MWIWIVIAIMIPLILWAKVREWKRRGGESETLLKKEQDRSVYVVDGREYARIRFGNEKQDWGAESQSCHDCGALKGQFHRSGCDVEQCPVCEEQAISCSCRFEGVEK